MKNLKANKKATRGKIKSWKKGQSCSYNPKFNKFRLQARKKNSIGFQGGTSNLTESAVARHNKTALDHESQMDEDPNFDGLSVGGQSFFSTFSHCTNPSFNRLIKHWRSDSVLHKEMLAVLAAVTEVIKAKGGKETETEYFAALVTTLDVVETDEAFTAVITLLYMIVKRLPISVLRYNFQDTCTTLKKLLLKYSESDYNALLRNLLGILFYFLKAQNSTSWNEFSMEIYNTLLEFCIFQKPRVRKSAQNAIRSLLNIFDESVTEGSHPAAISTAQFCIQKLETSDGAQTPLHVLNLLQDIVGYFPKAKLKLCCETVLKTMTLSNVIVITSCLGVLRGLFLMSPKQENLPIELNVRIIKALYDYRPNINDSVPLINWLSVMENAFLNLYRLDPNVCLSHLPKFFKVVTGCWLSDKHDVHPAVTSSLSNILKTCMDPTSPAFQQLMLDNPIDNSMHKTFHFVEAALSYQYHQAWKQVLIILASYFDIMGKYSYTVMLKCLQSLADLRDSFKFPHIAELDKAFGNAIHRMGPEIVLKAVPLQIDTESDKLDFPRSWLLPLLRDHVKETELGFFIRYFLPLALHLKKRASENEDKLLKSKTYEVLCSQIWSLLPGFCTQPTDLKETFKNIAEILGTTLSRVPDLRMPVLSSLRILITKNLENEENKKVLAYFAKNYLPILFNLYTTGSQTKGQESVRLAVYETVKIYLKITDKSICENFFKEIMKNLQKSESFLKQAQLDLNRALLPYVNEDLLTEFYSFCKPLLEDNNHTIQKKSYSVLNELCSTSTPTCLAFLTKNLNDLKSLLLTSLSSSAPSSKALRLSCLCYIVKQLSVDNKEFIISVIPEAILCTKATGEKARTTAFKLISEIGHVLEEWEPNNKKGVLRDYMQMLLAGFGGNPHMISATILAIGHVIYEFKDNMDPDILHLLIENVCLLLTSKSREVVTSALSFVKILFSVISTDDLAQHVEYLVKSIAAISEDNQRHFRFKAKKLFTRLIRKFGYEMISKLAPEKFQKQLTHIRKLEAQKQRKRDGKYDNDEDSDNEIESIQTRGKDEIEDILQDTDDELDFDDSSMKSKSKKGSKTKSTTWIEEKSENDIVDFLDPTTIKKITATKPEKSNKQKHSDDFEIAEDGRLIITDDNDAKQGTSKGNIDMDDEMENKSKGKKRKLADDSDSDIDMPLSSQKPVTKGIHRNTLKKGKLTRGEQYKAKKASGDMKKGKFDPYAHITFDRKLLNKRKKKKLQGQFKGLVHAAKKGAKKGLKAKAKKNRRKT